MRRAVLVLVSSLALGLVPLDARAGDSPGEAAFHRGDFDSARALWKAPAKAGDHEAQWLLGRLLLIAGDMEGVAWIQTSADAGYVPAMLRMALNRIYGFYHPGDRRACVAWLRKIEALPEETKRAHGCEAGAALHLLAYAYREGVGGLSKDRGRYVALLRQAADMGHPEAQFLLAKALHAGRDIPHDIPRAYLYYILSWKQEWKGAREAALALRKRLTAKQLEQAKALARDWMGKKDEGTVGCGFEAGKKDLTTGEERIQQAESMQLEILQAVMSIDRIQDLPCRPLDPTATKECPDRWIRSRSRVHQQSPRHPVIERWVVEYGEGTRAYRVVLEPGGRIDGKESIRWRVEPEGARVPRGRS